MGIPCIYHREGDRWIPSAEAKGPFPGQHGGAIAGVLAARLEEEAGRLEAGIALQSSTLLLRPAPVEPCTISISTVRAGGRVTVLAATLRIGDKDCALAQAIFVRPKDVGQWPLPTAEIYSPSNLEIVPRSTKFGSVPWFRDAVDMRRADGVFWLRSLIPVVNPPTPLARVCGHADWASGLSRHDSHEAPKVAGFPNVDLSVHLAREPRGEWVGLRPKSHWFANGMGMTDTEILDVYGPLGRACHTLVLLPITKPDA
jgi:hypothetical protein